VVISHLNNRIANQSEGQNSKHVEFLEIVTHQSQQIEKLEAECGMLYQLVPGLGVPSHGFLIRRYQLGLPQL